MLVTAAAVGLAVWKIAPVFSGFAEFDRAVFEATIRSFANPPFFVSGNGSHEQPWTLRMLTASASGNRRAAPSVISIGDDPDGVFQSSPPSAVDYAVILRNLKRLGVRRVAIPAVMAWDESDPIALTAVDTRLADFDSAVTAAPLTRGAVAEELPLPFLLASIPVSRVKGDVAALPQANRLALPGTFLGSGKTLAGFSILESEPGPPALLARWKDRIVFSFPVIAALAESGQAADQIEVRLGSYMKLGPAGPVVPIDSGGHLSSPVVRFSAKVVQAKVVIDATELESYGTVLLRDDRTTADAETKRFSESIADAITSISSETGLTQAKAFPRLSDPEESAMILLLSLGLAALVPSSVFRLRLIFGLAAALVLIAQLSGLALFSLWLPLYPSLCAIAASYLVAWPKKAAAPAAEPAMEPVIVPEPPLEPAPPEPAPQAIVEEPPSKAAPTRKPKGVPAKKVAKKVVKKAAKKVVPVEPEPVAEKPVKKVAKKATPAKKAAKKTAAASEKPPAKKAAKKTAKKAAKKTPKLPESE